MREVKILNKIVGYRKMLGLTQEEMAKTLDLSIVAYRNKESGKTQFKEKEMLAFHKICLSKIPNITLDEIFLM